MSCPARLLGCLSSTSPVATLTMSLASWARLISLNNVRFTVPAYGGNRHVPRLLLGKGAQSIRPRRHRKAFGFQSKLLTGTHWGIRCPRTEAYRAEGKRHVRSTLEIQSRVRSGVSCLRRRNNACSCRASPQARGARDSYVEMRKMRSR